MSLFCLVNDIYISGLSANRCFAFIIKLNAEFKLFGSRRQLLFGLIQIQNISYYSELKMKEFLSTHSVVSIYHSYLEERHFLTTKSLIKSNIYLSTEPLRKDFQNTLFFIEIDGNNMEFNIPIQYDQPVIFRHKISQKYLSLIVDEEDEKQVKYRLALSHEKKYFKINPCYQYQTKISTKIKFNEEIYLCTDYTSSQSGSVVTQIKGTKMELLLGFNKGEKFQFHFYSIYEKEQKYYKYGKIVWLSHIESDNFLSNASVNGKDEIIFQSIRYDKQIQNLSALWTLQSSNITQSNNLKFDEEIRFKNLFSGQYLCFSRNYKLVDNQRIYQIYLDDQGGDYSKFMFKSIKEKQKREIEYNSYLSFLHYQSNLFLGCRKERVGEQYYKLLTFPYNDDEDLFKIHFFNVQEEQALRFIFAIRKQFLQIAQMTKLGLKNISLIQLLDFQDTYKNVKQQLSALKKYEKLFQFVRNELGSSIKFIAENMQFLQKINLVQATSAKAQKIIDITNSIVKLSYQILCIFCENHYVNQIISFAYMGSYVQDVGLRIGAEDIIIETFRNNKDLLPKIGKIVSGRQANLVNTIFSEFKKNCSFNDHDYWESLTKIINVLNILLFYNNSTLDINQNVISQQLFGKDTYQDIFLTIKVQGQHIIVSENHNNEFQAVEAIKQPRLNRLIDTIFDLFSNLVNDHSLVSKQYIHRYLSKYNQACLSIFISYLNKNIRKQFYDTLIDFIAKCYIDSSPRLRRYKPMSYLFFNFEQERTNIEQQQAYYSGRLKEMLMLKAEQSRVCKPLHYSNMIQFNNTTEPTMSEGQLVIFRLNLTQKILNSRYCSLQQLQTIDLLINLQCYTTNEILQMYEELKAKLLLGNVTQRLVPKLLQIFDHMFLLIQQLQMKKLKIYLQHKFVEKQDLAEEQYKYVLPLSFRASIPFHNQGNTTLNNEFADLTQRSLISQNYITDYNQLRDTLALMRASPQLKNSLMKYFCNFKINSSKLSEEQASQYLESIFNCLLQSYLPKYKFLILLKKCTILTHEEIGQFDQYFDLTKKLQYLVLISQSWLVSDNQPKNVEMFLDIMRKIIEFLFEDDGQLAVKRQMMVGNLGVHRYVFELLEKNSYILEFVGKKELKKKYKDVFQICFQFIYYLIKHCSENKQQIYENFQILRLYFRHIELGQMKVYTEFYRDEKDYVKEIGFSMIENLILRIIRKPNNIEKYDQCEYNPQYINFVSVLIETLDMESKFFIERFYNLISKVDIFHRLLFLDDGVKQHKHVKFCLKMHKMKIEPIQIPIFYHLQLLKLLRLIATNSSQIIKNSLKLKLSQMFSLDYLLEFLSQPDIYSNVGIGPQLNFLLKEQMIKFILFLLEKSEFASELFQSEALSNLLDFYSRVFIKKVDRKQLANQSQSLYIHYLEQYTQYISSYLNNRDLYYEQHVKPLINKIVSVFQRFPNKSAKSPSTKKLFLIRDTLSNSTNSEEFRKRATTFGPTYGINDIKLKWRNFVDDDENNSLQQKFAKKNVLDILKSGKAQKFILEQLTVFYQAIKVNSKSFISSLIKLLTILFESRDISDGRKKEAKTIEKALFYFSGYITFNKDETEVKSIIQILQQHNFIEIFISLTARKQFEMTKMHLKNIFYYCLKILNFLLEKDNFNKFNKILYKIFMEHTHQNKFLQFLKEGALQVISTIDSKHYYEQINSALQKMSLCADLPPPFLYEESYKTLTFLCKYQPFTNYLRSQQSIIDIDFLDKIFNILTFLFNDHNALSKIITVSTVRASEYILDFVSSMFTGGNKVNQNYIMDSKYANFVHQILKIEKLEPLSGSHAVREELLMKIIEFYHSNGIQMSDLLRQTIRVIDFREQYLLNRFKYILVKTLLECMIANSSSLIKFKIEIPLQIVKLNLIWIYQAYKKGNYSYEQKLILHTRNDWKQIAQSKVPSSQQLFLRLGFYYYQLIQVASDKQNETQAIENQEKIVNEEKQKERVVKKFFSTLKEYSKNIENQKILNKQQMGEQMKYYYHMYYNALIFFRKKTGTIQVSIKQNIIQVYYPRLPLAQAINNQMQDQFKQNAVRISRDQKIKSLMEWQTNFYEDLEGQDNFFKEMEQKMTILGPILRMMKHENQFLLIAWFTSLSICIIFLVENYEEPIFQFAPQFFVYITPSTLKPMHTIMLLFSIFNLVIGLVIGFYLFTRKIPLRKKLLQFKYSRLKQAERQTMSKHYFVWSNIIKQTAYIIFLLSFLILTILHPFFSVFPLVQIINRIQMGRFIIRSLKQTWFQLLVTVALLIVFNIICTQLTYEFFTAAPGYGLICKTEFTCLLLYTDQNLKGGQGMIGNVQMDYTNMTFNGQVFYEILYILFNLKVIFEIFSGIIIDKFSELRERKESIENDETTICYICGQERFDLDLQYEGFDTHIEESHRVLHYIQYLFYLRRCQPIQYGIVERLISQCKLRQSQDWIPENNSLFKQNKEKAEHNQEQQLNFKQKVANFCNEKLKEMKKMHQKVEIMIKDLKKQSVQTN